MSPSRGIVPWRPSCGWDEPPRRPAAVAPADRDVTTFPVPAARNVTPWPAASSRSARPSRPRCTIARLVRDSAGPEATVNLVLPLVASVLAAMPGWWLVVYAGAVSALTAGTTRPGSRVRRHAGRERGPLERGSPGEEAGEAASGRADRHGDVWCEPTDLLEHGGVGLAVHLRPGRREVEEVRGR